VVQCAQLMSLVCSSGRPFVLMHVRVVALADEAEAEAEDDQSTLGSADVVPGSGQVGEVWCKGPTVFSGWC